MGIHYAADGEDKTVKLCRCWQSKRFPFCDDTHKVLIEAGDEVGPYVVTVKGGSPTRNVAADTVRMRSQVPRNAFFFALGFGTVGLACVAVSRAMNGKRLSFGFTSPFGRGEGG